LLHQLFTIFGTNLLAKMKSTKHNTNPPLNQTKLNVQAMIPGLIELTSVDLDFPWDSINRSFSDIWRRKIAESDNETFQTEATFFFMLLAAMKGEPLAIGYVDYLNRMCHELSGQLSIEKKKMLGKIIKKIIKVPNLDFLNFVGELSTLNNLLKSNAYELERIESPLKNDNSIDFHLKDLATQKSILVEVINIQLNDDKVERDPDAINTFLTGRLIKKIAEKEEELAGTLDFWIVAVLWGSWKSIQIYRDHFRSYPVQISRTIEPLAYVQHSDGRGYYMHQFGRVSTLRILS
jgi:hypothetical protein